jgi:membrane-bound serine protease (ClpP class)
VAALAMGAVLLIDSESPGFGISPAVIGGVTIVSAGFVLIVAGMAAKARRRPVVSGESSLLGATGPLVEFAAGEGWASVRGEPWRVRGSAALAVGQTVRVVAVQGNTLEVAPAEVSSKGA